MPISVAGIAREGERYFLALRKPGTSIGACWEFPGGKVKPGESPEEALVREYREEFALDVSVGEACFEGSFTNRSVRYRMLAFRINFLGRDITLAEHSKARWVRPEELPQLPMAYSDNLIREFLLGESS